MAGFEVIPEDVTSAHYKHYFVPAGRWTVHNIYRRPENIAFRIDDKARTASILRCGCTWEETTPPPPDRECSAVAAARFGVPIKIAQGTVAGIPVIRYRGTRTENEHEVAFGPGLGCDLLEERNATHNVIGLPTSRFHFVVRSYVPGEPDQKVLHPPAQYALHDKPFLP